MSAASESQSLSKVMLLTLIESISGLMSSLKWVFKTAYPTPNPLKSNTI